MKYSVTTGCFYPDWGEYPDLPDDAREVPDDEAEAAIARPEGTMIKVVDGNLSIVPIPPPPIAEQRAAVWEKIKAERDRRKDGGVLVDGKWYHSDQSSRIQQIGLVMAGATVPAIPWKTMDGSFVTMSQALAGKIFQAGFALDTALFTRAEQHKTAMEAGSDPHTYDFSTGWPERYGDGL
jgi:hypothetical protein